MENNENSSYRSIFKATSLFGGVQIYQVLIQIIKSKIIAVLLGPLGVGILGLYTSATKIVQDLSSLGLSQSAVRDISEANASDNINRVSHTVAVVRKLVWITGLFGLIIVIVFSPLISKTTFGNLDYTVPFIILSSTILLDQLSSGQRVLLQGLRRLKDLAKASAIGSTLGLIVSIPLYYLLGVKGIVPTLVLNSLTMLLLTWFFSRRIKIPKTRVSNKEAFIAGSNMIKMGVSLSVSAIMVSLTAYILRGYIRSCDGPEFVGFYQAGFAIVNSYVGLVFTAISTDYYPRLASVNQDNQKCTLMVNQQGEIATLIIAPLLISCMVFSPLIISILYTDSFLVACGFMVWACFGMMFKLSSWLISFLFVAKAEARLFVILEVSINILMLVLSIFFYDALGIKGLGVAYTITYLIYFVTVLLLAKKKYCFAFSITFIKEYSRQFLFVIVGLLISLLIESSVLRFCIGGSVIIISLLFSYKGLEERIKISAFLKRKK